MSNTYSMTTTNGIMLTSPGSPAPAGAPKGLIVTRALELKGGWVGQIVVAEEIVWESDTFTEEKKEKSPSARAEEAATERVVAAIKALFR